MGRGVPLEHLPPYHRAVDVAVSIHSDALGAGVIRTLRLQVFDERADLAIARAAHTDSFRQPVTSPAPVSGPVSESAT